MNAIVKVLAIAFAVAGILALGSSVVQAAGEEKPFPETKATTGQKAPDFTLADTHGKNHSLAQYAGKTVVLEWVNFKCPFVGKHYDSGNMQKLQKDYTGKGVVWLSICSSAAGKPGNLPLEELNELLKSKGAAPTAYLVDSDGKVGRLYGAMTTPDMFVIDPAQKIVYSGAIDDKVSTDVSDVAHAKNYVVAALDEVMAGKPVKVASTKSYGCSVKY